MINTNKIINLETARQTTRGSVAEETRTGFSFEAEVEKDIQKLRDALGISREEAIDMAKNFYRKYPMLIEFVRTPNELLRR